MLEAHRGLAHLVIALAAICAVWALVQVVRGVDPGRGLVLATFALSAATSVTAVLGLSLLSSGHEPKEKGLHLLYGAAAVVFVPVAAIYARDATPRWRSGILAIAATAVLIVALRQLATGGG